MCKFVVSIKDYGDLENKKLADRYHVKTDAFPVIKLFIEGDLESPIDFNIGKLSNDLNFKNIKCMFIIYRK